MSAWRAIGLCGTALFAGRWVVQLVSARRARASVVTPGFWMMSLGGSSLLLLYFGASPQADLVGFLGNALPFATALFNLWLCTRRPLATER